MTEQTAYVGVDLGGTYVRVGILDGETARLLAFVQAPIEASQGAAKGIHRIIRTIESALDQSGCSAIAGIGIGATGPVDRQKGLIQNPYTLPGWEEVAISAPLARHFEVPVSLENDADAAALGEYWAGAGKGAERMYMVTLGTGIGTALIYHGEIYRGLDDAHPDGGHQILDPAGPICYCGARGCWESLASGAAIGRNARASLAEHPGTLLSTLSTGDPEQIDARMVADAAFQGDELALSIYQQAAHYFALGIVNVITLFVPDVIVLGGGVMKSSPLFLPVLTQEVAGHNIMVPAMQVKILLAQLGSQAGVVGAAYSILQKTKENRI